jgi:hypothetical protein
MDRQDCINVIQRAGLPVPPKSSCYFCPFHRMSVWQEMRQKQPDLFWKAAALEETINKRREMLGKDKVWLTRKLMPLALATTEMVQRSIFDPVVDTDTPKDADTPKKVTYYKEVVTNQGVLRLQGSIDISKLEYAGEADDDEVCDSGYCFM